jgi:hypothetical protein
MSNYNYGDDPTPEQVQSSVLNRRQMAGEAPSTNGPQGFDVEKLQEPQSGDSGTAPQRLSSSQFGNLSGDE